MSILSLNWPILPLLGRTSLAWLHPQQVLLLCKEWLCTCYVSMNVTTFANSPLMFPWNIDFCALSGKWWFNRGISATPPNSGSFFFEPWVITVHVISSNHDAVHTSNKSFTYSILNTEAMYVEKLLEQRLTVVPSLNCGNRISLVCLLRISTR